MQLTLLGEPARHEAVQVHECYSEEHIRQNVRSLFADHSDGYITDGKERQFAPFLFRHTHGYSFVDDVLHTLRWLPADHPAVDEVVTQVGTILRAVPTMTRDELRTPVLEKGIELDLPLFTSFIAAGNFGPQRIYDDVKRACYHLAQLNLHTADEPPEEDLLVYHGSSALWGYRKSHPRDVRDFYSHLQERRVAPTLVLGLYVDSRDERAIPYFMELFTEARGEDSFMIRGNRCTIYFDYFASRLYTVFGEEKLSTYAKRIDTSLEGKLAVMLSQAKAEG